MPQSETSLRDTLKTETRDAHKELDVIVANLQIFSSVKRYRMYLRSMYLLYDYYGSEIDWASRQAGISESVKGLKAAIELDCCEDLKDTSEVPKQAAESVETKWAVGYVMEGSAMGARFMVKQADVLVTNLDCGSESSSTLSPMPGCRYLKKLAADSFERWPKFVTALDLVDCDYQPIVNAANEVFDTAKKLLSSSLDCSTTRHH